MSQKEADIIDIEDYRKVWETGRLQCVKCGFICVTTVHKEADKKKLECLKCGTRNSWYGPIDK